jgi:hypothetical protein
LNGLQAQHPLATYQAAVISANGEHMPTDMAGSAALLSRLAFRLFGFHLRAGYDAHKQGNHDLAFWHYLCASETGSNIGTLNALSLIRQGCAARRCHTLMLFDDLA